MHAQTISTTTNTEVTPARAIAAMADAVESGPYHQALASYRHAKATYDEAATTLARLPADCSAEDEEKLGVADNTAFDAKIAALVALSETPAPTLQDAIDKAILMQNEMEPHERPLVLGDRCNQPEAVRRALLEIQAFAAGTPPIDHRASFHNSVWTHLVEEFETAQDRSNTVAIDLPDEEARPITDAAADAQMRVLMAPTPGIEAHLYKLHFGIDEQRYAYQTLDDRLRWMVMEGWDTQREAIAYLDAWQLARMAGVDNDLTRALYPRAINARLAKMGCQVTHWCLSTPKGFRGEAMALYGMFTEAEQHQLFAAAWIDGFLAAGGTLHLWKNGDSDKRVLHFGVSMDRQPELQPFVDALSNPSKDGGPPPPSEQRLDVAKLATEQMNGRGVDYMGAEEAGLPPVDPYTAADSNLIAAE